MSGLGWWFPGKLIPSSSDLVVRGKWSLGSVGRSMGDLVLDAGSCAVSNDSLARPVLGGVVNGFLACFGRLSHPGVFVSQDTVHLHRGVEVAGQLGCLPVLMGGSIVRVWVGDEEGDIGMAKEITDVVDGADKSL